jgi:hypothetical protein
MTHNNASVESLSQVREIEDFNVEEKSSKLIELLKRKKD